MKCMSISIMHGILSMNWDSFRDAKAMDLAKRPKVMVGWFVPWRKTLSSPHIWDLGVPDLHGFSLCCFNTFLFELALVGKLAMFKFLCSLILTFKLQWQHLGLCLVKSKAVFMTILHTLVHGHWGLLYIESYCTMKSFTSCHKLPSYKLCKHFRFFDLTQNIIPSRQWPYKLVNTSMFYMRITNIILYVMCKRKCIISCFFQITLRQILLNPVLHYLFSIYHY
jgi:hypothetical protein